MVKQGNGLVARPPAKAWQRHVEPQDAAMRLARVTRGRAGARAGAGGRAWGQAVGKRPSDYSGLEAGGR